MLSGYLPITKDTPRTHHGRIRCCTAFITLQHRDIQSYVPVITPAPTIHDLNGRCRNTAYASISLLGDRNKYPI